MATYTDEKKQQIKQDLIKTSTSNVLSLLKQAIEEGNSELSQLIQDTIIEEHGEGLFKTLGEISKK